MNANQERPVINFFSKVSKPNLRKWKWKHEIFSVTSKFSLTVSFFLHVVVQ